MGYIQIRVCNTIVLQYYGQVKFFYFIWCWTIFCVPDADATPRASKETTPAPSDKTLSKEGTPVPQDTVSKSDNSEATAVSSEATAESSEAAAVSSTENQSSAEETQEEEIIVISDSPPKAELHIDIR